MRLPAGNAKGTESSSGDIPLENNPVPFEKPVGEPYSGTDPKRLWLLRSRPDQVHRRTMRRGPPSKILAELRVARSASLLLGGPRGAVCAPPPRPSPRGGGRKTLLRLSWGLASLCLALPCFTLLCLGGVIGLSGSGAREAELRVARSASLLLGGPRGAVCAPPPRPSPRGGGRKTLLRLSWGLASLCLTFPWLLALDFFLKARTLRCWVRFGEEL
ncbi:hypothetical protein AX27061_4820 [Achromobacter xylosoxidans NBRC 15126 = ATCC 27061]|nr:hypothetical protein AX27061_4820 [Achromobacter xylosoxidans NBRC 15126 = ATCC 27061]